MSEGTNTFQKSAFVANDDGRSNIGPSPPARLTIQTSSHTPISKMRGADQFSKMRTAFIPTRTIKILIDQKIMKVMADGIPRPMIMAPPPT